MKITTDTIRTEKIDIHVDNSGRFWAKFNEEHFEDETRKGLLAKLEKAVKAAESERALPVTFLNVTRDKRGDLESGRGVLHAKLRGKHQRESGAYLYMDEDGKKFKHGGWQMRGAVLCRRLSDDEIARYTTLTAAIDTAQAAFDEWRKTVEVEPDELLDAK